MKKLTLLKLVFIIVAALSLYGQAATPATTTGSTCPTICFHIFCEDWEHAFFSNGKCVCP